MIRLFKLAWRDLWRNQRRTLLTMGAVIFAVVLISLSSSVERGTYNAMEETIVRMHTSDLQVHRAGFYTEQTLSYSMNETEQEWDSLQAVHPWIMASARRLSGYGLASSDSSSAGTMILGIEPKAERTISTFSSNLTEGEELADGDRNMVALGETLAKNLNLTVGDSLVVLTQGYRNVMGADLYAVKGLLRTGNADIDRTLLVMPLPDAQYLLSMEGRFTEWVVRTDNFRQAASYAETLHAHLSADKYEVLPWRAMMPELEQMRTLDDAGNYIFYFLLILLIGFEIFNTTSMSMIERVREFGVMMSIGMKPRQISLLVAMELALKVFLALVVGFVVAFVIVWIMSENPIPITGKMKQFYEDFGFVVDGISFSRQPTIFVFPMVSVAAVALLSMVYPILWMRRFSPVEALRKT